VDENACHVMYADKGLVQGGSKGLGSGCAYAECAGHARSASECDTIEVRNGHIGLFECTANSAWLRQKC
jgi:hypothetical protein